MNAVPDTVLLMREEGLAHLRLNRPEALNILDVPTAALFARRCREIAHGPTLALGTLKRLLRNSFVLTAACERSRISGGQT